MRMQYESVSLDTTAHRIDGLLPIRELSSLDRLKLTLKI